MTSPAPTVALVGGANMDIAAHSHATLLPGDSNPGRIVCSPGGVARNVAENLLRLGVDARLLSVLGDDAFGAALRQSAAAIGLDLRGCTTLPGQRTATYLSLHGADGEMGVAVNDMDILDQLSPALLQTHADLLAAATLRVVDCNLRSDALAWLCAPGAVVFAEAVSVAKCRKLLPLLAQIHLLKANRLEAQALSGLPIATPQAALQAAQALQQRGARNVVISLGAAGVAWCDSAGNSGHRPAQSLPMCSATGAGDALLAGLVYGHLQGMPLAQAVRFAMGCAELTLSSTFANSPALCVAAVHTHLEAASP